MASVTPQMVRVDTANGGGEYVFSIRDGIQDDVSRVTDSLVYGTPIRARDILLTGVAAVSASYIGIHMFRFMGFRTDLGGAVGAVAGGVILDYCGKMMIKRRAERTTNAR